MQLEIVKNSQIAPMSDFCRQWQQTGEIDMSWYFEQAEQFGVDKIIFNSVQLESPLFQRLKEKTLEHKMAPVYVVTTEQFCDLKNLRDHLLEGVHYTVLVYSPLSTELIYRVEGLREFLQQLSFVILARKDWNVRNCYRSVPHFMRSRLFVDFPVSIHESDPFYEPAELTSTRQKFERDFLDKKIPSFCPNLGIYNEWGKKNISHFSRPRKFLKNKPKISIVALDPNALQPLLDSKVLQNSPDDFEILITRVAGQKTKVIPKVKSVISTRYWAHPIDADKNVSPKVLANFTACQADGDILLFLDPKVENNIDGLFSALLSGEANLGKLLVRKGLFVFQREDFLKWGGFNELFTTWDADRIHLQDSLYPELVSESETKNLGPVLGRVANSCDQLLLAHHFADRIEDFSFLDGVAPTSKNLIEKQQDRENKRYEMDDLKKQYRSLLIETPAMALRSRLQIILQFYKLYAWRVSPLRLRHYYRKNLWRYNFVHHFYHFCRKHSWKVSPLRLRHYIRLYYWHLNPWSYRITWQIRYLPRRIYWIVFKIAFPLRKIYYFGQFQYEKRILGLHRKPVSSRDS